ncbi:Man1-Src1p-C-terminal domain-containing protein [Mrakia frigida]|uniref:Man1-Src1p-C-terminal domain-containing protein n=1 Tax=Mrakia frigida TaxID=29902 RepID=UPI003FCBF8BF
MSSGVPPPEVYFADDFDPYSLKVAQLRNILLQHSRALPSNAKKAELVAEFIAGVLPLKQAILKAQSKVKSSSAGITIMGEPHLDEPVSPVRRRKSRQSLAAQAQAQEEAEDGQDEDPAQEEPPKAKRSSRRSSALPSGPSSLAVPGSGKTIRRTRSRDVLPQPPQQVEEESEPEDDVIVAVPSPSPPPPATEEEKPKKKHRESAKHPAFVDVEEKEGFSDYNPFQSGGESPDQKREKKLRRKSSLGVGSASAFTSTSKRRQSELPQASSSRTTGGMSSSFSIPNLGGFRSPESSPVSTPVKADPPLADTSFKNKGRKSLPAGLTAQRFMPDVESLQTPPSEWKEAQRSASSSGKKKEVKTERERSLESGDGELLMVEDSDEGREATGAGEVAQEEKEDENAGFVKHNNVVSKKLSNLDPSTSSPAKTPSSSSSALVPSKLNKKKSASSSALTLRPKSSTSSVVKTSSVVLPSLGALLSLFLYLLQWTSKSASLGFCDPNSNTNSILLSRQQALASARLCIERHASGEEDVAPYGDGAVCDASALPLLPSFIPTPTTCTPCPNHGICAAGTFVGCDKEYILKPNLVESLVSMIPGAEGALQVMNGVPGLGSVAFPPSCVPDNEKRKLVGGMARAIEGELAKERGRGVCEMGRNRDGEEEEFGVGEIRLREEFLERKDPSFSLAQFLEIFNIAVKDLVEHGDIASGVDSDGQRWLAAHRGEMGLVCQARVGTKEALHANKSTLSGIGVTLVAILVARSKLNSSMEESKKVKELVQVALTKLREQERVHYLDPVQASDPFIAPAQLRDLVLANEPSSVRQRLWKKVGAIVEGNSNVATREAEVRGEVHSVWEWKGVSLA